MTPWETLASASAPDGVELVLRRRAHEYLILAGGHDLMSSEDESSSRDLGTLGCAHIAGSHSAKVLVGGLGMGFTLSAALGATGPHAIVEVSELVAAVAEWNRGPLAELAGRPLDDPRAALHMGDVGQRIAQARDCYDAILLDVDNGPDALAHKRNKSIYGERGIAAAWRALVPGGVLGVWSYADDPKFTTRLERQGFAATVHKVTGSRKGRGRHHRVWIATRPRR